MQVIRYRGRRLGQSCPEGIVLILVVEPSFTAVGHIVAFAIGLALFRVVRNDHVEARATGAIYPRPLWRAQAAE